jgi:chromosome segregation ATPase
MNPSGHSTEWCFVPPQVIEISRSCIPKLGSRFAQTTLVIEKEEAMNLFRSTTAKIFIACFALIGLQAYGFMSMRHGFQDRMTALENQIQDVRSDNNAKSDQIASDLDVITKRIGITAQELEKAHTIAEQLKQENAKTAQKLHTEIASKADSQTVTQFRDEAATKLAEVQQDATTKLGVVSGDVQVVRNDLDATRQDLASSRKDITDVRSEIARNAGELAALRRKGERDYIEFDMRKSNQFQRIADVQVQLRKTDTKRQKYTVLIQADDNRVEKKDLPANEPVQFLVGRDRLRYEFVVNFVDKDRIRGYMSTPKDKVLAAEGPSTAQHQD